MVWMMVVMMMMMNCTLNPRPSALFGRSSGHAATPPLGAERRRVLWQFRASAGHPGFGGGVYRASTRHAGGGGGRRCSKVPPDDDRRRALPEACICDCVTISSESLKPPPTP